MAHTNYLNNPKLKANRVPIQFTEEQRIELQRCVRDPVYFIENYAKIVSLDDGIVLMKLFPYQKRIIKAIHNNRNIIGKLFRQAGKCLDVNTPIRIRNKHTGEIVEMTIGDLYDKISSHNQNTI